ncbi:hypothetical protein SSPS47_31950 [Streptomyces sp. S4.7]|nr:hypothetical protein SSPS47_31950 [Streptomyces sp. S4.7]
MRVPEGSGAHRNVLVWTINVKMYGSSTAGKCAYGVKVLFLVGLCPMSGRSRRAVVGGGDPHREVAAPVVADEVDRSVGGAAD